MYNGTENMLAIYIDHIETLNMKVAVPAYRQVPKKTTSASSLISLVIVRN